MDPATRQRWTRSKPNAPVAAYVQREGPAVAPVPPSPLLSAGAEGAAPIHPELRAKVTPPASAAAQPAAPAVDGVVTGVPPAETITGAVYVQRESAAVDLTEADNDVQRGRVMTVDEQGLADLCEDAIVKAQQRAAARTQS